MRWIDRESGCHFRNSRCSTRSENGKHASIVSQLPGPGSAMISSSVRPRRDKRAATWCGDDGRTIIKAVTISTTTTGGQITPARINIPTCRRDDRWWVPFSSDPPLSLDDVPIFRFSLPCRASRRILPTVIHSLKSPLRVECRVFPVRWAVTVYRGRALSGTKDPSANQSHSVEDRKS